MKTEHAADKAQGEWTRFGTSVQSDIGALFHCSTRKDAEIAAIEHNASITAEQERCDEIWRIGKAELAAEREKVQPLVDALKKCKSQLDMEPQRLPLVERLQRYIKDALP